VPMPNVVPSGPNSFDQFRSRVSASLNLSDRSGDQTQAPGATDVQQAVAAYGDN
jgi:hypothetical protein